MGLLTNKQRLFAEIIGEAFHGFISGASLERDVGDDVTSIEDGHGADFMRALQLDTQITGMDVGLRLVNGMRDTWPGKVDYHFSVRLHVRNKTDYPCEGPFLRYLRTRLKTEDGGPDLQNKDVFVTYIEQTLGLKGPEPTMNRDFLERLKTTIKAKIGLYGKSKEDNDASAPNPESDPSSPSGTHANLDSDFNPKAILEEVLKILDEADNPGDIPKFQRIVKAFEIPTHKNELTAAEVSDVLATNPNQRSRPIGDVGHYSAPGRNRGELIQPGLSVGQNHRRPGTLGAIVFDGNEPMILSCWHVLAHSDTRRGDRIYQPAPGDGGDEHDLIAYYVRDAMGLNREILPRSSGDEDQVYDAAVASIDQFRQEKVSRNMLGLTHNLNGVPLDATVSSSAGFVGERVVKSGKGTGVTRGIVEGWGVYFLDYGRRVGRKGFWGMMITPEIEGKASELSAPGDSGSIWFLDPKAADEKTTEKYSTSIDPNFDRESSTEDNSTNADNPLNGGTPAVVTFTGIGIHLDGESRHLNGEGKLHREFAISMDLHGAMEKLGVKANPEPRPQSKPSKADVPSEPVENLPCCRRCGSRNIHCGHCGKLLKLKGGASWTCEDCSNGAHEGDGHP